jgi:hypothetical protein
MQVGRHRKQHGHYVPVSQIPVFGQFDIGFARRFVQCANQARADSRASLRAGKPSGVFGIDLSDLERRRIAIQAMS